MPTPMSEYTSQFKNNQPLPEFESQRKRLKSQLDENAQLQREALERRFAQLQGGPSGAQVKVGQQLEGEIFKQQGQAQEGLDAQEIAVRRQMDEADKQRDFQRELVSKDDGFKQKVFEFEKETKLKQIDMATREFDADQRTTEFNKMISILGLSKGDDQKSGFRGIIEDPNSSAAAKAAATQYLSGMNDKYLSVDEINAVRAGQAQQAQLAASNQKRIDTNSQQAASAMQAMLYNKYVADNKRRSIGNTMSFEQWLKKNG
jgi:predicted DNA-binding protein